MQSARVRGYDRESKFYFNLQISESKSVLPETIRAMLAKLKKETNGDDDYPYNSFEITSSLVSPSACVSASAALLSPAT